MDVNEGIYVKNKKSGEVRAVIGETYLIESYERLWAKELSPNIEYLLGIAATGQPYVPAIKNEDGTFTYEAKIDSKYNRDKTKIVSFKVQHNSIAQLFDYKTKVSRFVVGPNLALLRPYEEFTVLSLTGGLPKVEGIIKALSLNLGPDFMRDEV